MPLYDYQCNQCGHRFEVRQGIKEDPLTVCPQCGGPVRRVIHPVGIVFKGSGFYITDSRKASSATTPAGSGSGASGDSAGADKDKKKETTGTTEAASSSAESKPAAASTGSAEAKSS